MKDKFILDACCGGRWFWFNKNHPNTLYIDNRKCEKGHDNYRKNHSVEPDMIEDFRNMPFDNQSFKLVVFDPPHMKTLGENSKFKRYYGKLNKDTWKEDLFKGFNECIRVLENYGVLIFKWNECEIKKKEVLELFNREPLFGHPTNSKNNTHWFCFMKIPSQKQLNP